MRKRRGRPRKPGHRYRSGDRRLPAVSPREIAAKMPHRRGLGDKAMDQRAETELGRLVLRGDLDATLGLAGETYLALWRGYVFSLGGPSELTNGAGHGFTCDGCVDVEARRYCRCSFRKRIFIEARNVVLRHGAQVRAMVEWVVLHGGPLRSAGELAILRLGLTALARHFGLTPRQIVILGNAASDTASSSAP